LGELLGLIEKSSFPIIITANDIWQQKFNLLRQKSEVIGLKEIRLQNNIIYIKRCLRKGKLCRLK
jgi:hypothetical protein